MQKLDGDPLDDDSLRRAHTALIRYPHFNELHQDIRQCQYLSKMSGEPQCMSLEGPPGAGKSTLVKEYARAFPRLETPERTLIPVFYVETPSPVTVGGMASRMLEKLGDPAFDRGKISTLDSRLINHIIVSKVELVILDDFHHLIDKKTNRVLATVSDWLKVLIKETEVPFLVVGIEGQVEEILRANAQLSRLFAVRETLQPFRWDTRKPSSIKQFAQFVNYAEKAIQMPLTTQIRRLELLFRLSYATNGVVANIMNLLRSAQLYALRRKSSSIELCDLSQAFQKHVAKHLRLETNPFDVKDEKFALPAQTAEAKSVKEEESSTGNRSRRRKKREPGIGETLKTT